MARGPLSLGRPDKDTTKWRHRMSQLLKRVTNDDDVIEVWEHVQEMAKTSNDIAWAILFLNYTIGKPPSQDQQAGNVQVDGDVTLTINQLSLEEVQAIEAAAKTIDAAFSPVLPAPDAH